MLKQSTYFFYDFTYVFPLECTSFHRMIAVTDFEPTEARMAFPCFDEPLFKANFSIKIRRESRHIALSNMPKVCHFQKLWEIVLKMNFGFCCVLIFALFAGLQPLICSYSIYILHNNSNPSIS